MPLPQASTEDRVVSTVKTLTRNRRGRRQSAERLTQQGFNASGTPRRLTEAAIDQGGKLGYGLAMTPDAALLLQKLTEFCHEKWEDAHNAPDSAWPTHDMLTGKKMGSSGGSARRG